MARLYSEDTSSRVMVFIDYRNFGDILRFDPPVASLDMFRLTQELVGGRKLVGAYIFDGSFPDDDRNSPTSKDHRLWRDLGFRVVVREAVVNGAQKEVDVALACEMVKHALMNHYDVAIVVSGDRDFVPAMQEVQSAGKLVEVAALNAYFSAESKRTADAYYELDSLPIMQMRTLDSVDQEGPE